MVHAPSKDPSEGSISPCHTLSPISSLLAPTMGLSESNQTGGTNVDSGQIAMSPQYRSNRNTTRPTESWEEQLETLERENAAKLSEARAEMESQRRSGLSSHPEKCERHSNSVRGGYSVRAHLSSITSNPSFCNCPKAQGGLVSDYQKQLMRLEQANRERLANMARSGGNDGYLREADESTLLSPRMTREDLQKQLMELEQQNRRRLEAIYGEAVRWGRRAESHFPANREPWH